LQNADAPLIILSSRENRNGAPFSPADVLDPPLATYVVEYPVASSTTRKKDSNTWQYRKP
jgi:hypothetical protein